MEEKDGLPPDDIAGRKVTNKTSPNNRKQRRYVTRVQPKAEEQIKMQAIHPDTIRRAQRDDKGCDRIMTFIQTGALPKDNAEARGILLREEDFIVHEGVLFRFTAGQSQDAEMELRLVVPQ